MRKSPPYVSLYAFQKIINASIEIGDDRTFYEFLELTIRAIEEGEPRSISESSDNKSTLSEEYNYDTASSIQGTEPGWTSKLPSLIVSSEHFGFKTLSMYSPGYATWS